MLRSGQFENLQWDKLAEAHSANWGLLQNRYGLPLEQFPALASLDELATQVIKICQKYVFRDFWKQRFANGWETGTAAGLLPADELEEYFTPALSDHLVVTFAHRLLCDNLAPLTQSQCLDKIYDCRIESTPSKEYRLDHYGRQVENKDIKQKANVITPKAKACGMYAEKVGRLLTFYKSLLNSQCREAPADDSNKTGDLDESTKAELYLIDLEESIRIADRFSATNWIYSVALACNWTTSPFRVSEETPAFLSDYKNQRSQAFRLAKFLGDSEWGPLLYQLYQTKEPLPRLVYLPFTPTESQAEEIYDDITKRQPQIPPVVELRADTNRCRFVGVPYVRDKTYRHSLPPQKYTVAGSTLSFEIPVEIQQMLNCYLTEMAFHGFASMTALDCIRTRQNTATFEIHKDQYLQLPTVTRLRAPLVHSAMIRLLDDVIGQTTATQTAIPWIEEVIAVWNCMSLPVLEEMFIHAVWTNYKTESVDRVLNEVITALTKDEQSGAEGEAGSSCRRCDRLNFYRLVPIENFPEKAPLELRHDTIANQVIARTYMSGFGLSINPDKRRNAHLNYAMAFDDLTDTD